MHSSDSFPCDEYIKRLSKPDIQEWKARPASECDFEDNIPAHNQITFSWCDINAFSKDEKADNDAPDYTKILPRMKTTKEEAPKMKHILKNVNGFAHPGELLVIMGSSGAGKTTLLNCMTYRNLKYLTVSGLICINNSTVNQTELAARSAYVQQDDLFIKYLTVKEHLTFQSKVKMDASYTNEERRQRVERVMRELSLKKCQDCIIGLPGIVKGISGGERKRLAFASELLTNPALLFCDEPTTGLDSFMSLNVVQMLKDIAATGRTVIATLHQPSSEIFHMFDKLCLMAEGRTAFLGSVHEASTFFTKLGAPCPRNYNPADHYIQLLSILPGKEEHCVKSVNAICNAFENSTLGVKIKQTNEQTMKRARDRGEKWVRKHGHVSPYRVGWCAQMSAVFWRSWLSIVKDPCVTKIKCTVVVAESILITLIYFGQVMNQLAIKNLDGVIFFLILSTSFQNVYTVLDTFCNELPIFLKEHKDGMYRTDVYFFSKMVTDMPFAILFAILNTLICYFFVGMNPALDRFLWALAISVLISQCAQGAGYIISTLAGSIHVAVIYVSILITPLVIFGGAYLNISSVPSYLQWLADVSWFKYGYEAFMINQWSGIQHIPCGSNSTTHSVCVHDGTEVLLSNSVPLGDFWPAMFAMIGLAIFFRIIAFFMLLHRASKED